MTNAPLQRAVDVAGGQSALARKIGTRQSLIWHWLERSKKGVPAEWCQPIERETGVLAAELRPDLFASNSTADHSELPLIDCGENGADAANCPVPNAQASAQAGA